MAGVAVMGWHGIRAAMAARKVTGTEVAARLGIKYQHFSTIKNTDDQTQPTPEFAERVLRAIEEAAAAKAGR